MHLITNATEAIQGSGIVTIATKNQIINDDNLPNPDIPAGQYAVASITDSGGGINDCPSVTSGPPTS